MVSLMWLSVRSQCMMSFSNTMKNLDAFIVDSITVFSSRAANMSSVLRSLNVDLYSAMSRTRPDLQRRGGQRGGKGAEIQQRKTGQVKGSKGWDGQGGGGGGRGVC